MKQKTKQKSIQNEIREAPQEITPAEQEAENPYIIYNNDIELYTDEFISRNYPDKSKEELKQDKSFFPLLIDYLYDNCIVNILNNKNNKNRLYEDIELLDKLFYIYKKLVYMYKWNNKPYIIEFSLFTGINTDTFYNWISGYDKNIASGKASEYLTRERSDIVQKWLRTCEQALIDSNDTIKDIFLLKAKFNYKEGNNEININVNHKAIIDADNLPDLIGITSKN